MAAAAESRPGYRRRILIEPEPDAQSSRVSAELEDDYHRMAVTLSHKGGVITAVESVMKRSPWTTCPGAIAQLEATFRGKLLTDAIARDEKVRNCTHLFDLATFAAGHAGSDGPVAYDIEVSDSVDGVSGARLYRNGRLLFDWTFENDLVVSPPELAGADLGGIGRWAGQQEPDLREAARVLRWARLVGMGRTLEMPAGGSAMRFASGACFTFQPETAAIATRRPGADVDFTGLGTKPMADREDSFTRV